MMKVTKPISNLGVCCLCYSLYCTPWKDEIHIFMIMQEKGESNLKKLRHSITFKPGSCRETDSPGNHMKKVTKPICNPVVCCLHSLQFIHSMEKGDHIHIFHDMQEKGESELKKLRHSISFKPGSCRETDSLGNHMKKVTKPISNPVVCCLHCNLYTPWKG